MAYDDERGYIDPHNDKKLGETYKEAEQRQAREYDENRAWNRMMQEQREDAKKARDGTYRASPSYSGGGRAGIPVFETTKFATWLGVIGLVMLCTGVFLHFILKSPPIVWSQPLPKLLSVWGFIIMILCMIPRIIIGLFMLCILYVVYTNSRTTTGLQLSAMDSSSWGAIGLFSVAIILIFIFLVKK